MSPKVNNSRITDSKYSEVNEIPENSKEGVKEWSMK
jgi:hypothetical protein